MKNLLRNEINKQDITSININIEAYQKMADFYEDYLKEEYFEYVDQRLTHIYNILSEYLIARDIALKNLNSTHIK